MDKKIILYIVVGILVLGLLILTFFPGAIQSLKDSGKREKIFVPLNRVIHKKNGTSIWVIIQTFMRSV
ncbi:MAG: hypothetical protein Q8Q04_02710 [archaeon]|nr:hypothetical protein [archaeon]